MSEEEASLENKILTYFFILIFFGYFILLGALITVSIWSTSGSMWTAIVVAVFLAIFFVGSFMWSVRY